jgi:hypothetical protein
MGQEWSAILQALERGSVIAGLFLFAGGLMTGRILSRGQHEAILKLKDDVITRVERERDVALEGWRAQTAATERVAGAMDILSERFASKIEEAIRAAAAGARRRGGGA